MRINSSADDAAGFAVSQKMRAQISGLDRAIKNAQDGLSLIDTAEGALGETNAMLQRMRELAVQAGNDSLTSTDRQYIQMEIDELRDEIDRIAHTTQFNRKRILDGSAGTMWSSNDAGVKVRINGGLEYTDEFGNKVSSEGNYRIEVRGEPGQTQLQKSNIMLIKHKNVTMDRTINRLAGVDDVRVNNVPAGNYELTAEPPTEARTIATGAYGIELDELAQTLHASVSQNRLHNNASILFEVQSVDEDTGAVILNAISHVLKTDGTTETHTQNNITLTESVYVDLSTALGLGYPGTNADNADGAFELQLQPGMTSKLAAGDKFVYNLNIAKDVEGADRGVKITSERNTSWPENWQETMEIQTSNSFEQPEGSIQARVLFVIDDSGSMSGATSKLAGNLGGFIQNIANERVDEVSVGVASYSMVSGTQRLLQHTINGNQWETVDSNNPAAATTTLQDIKDTLQNLADMIYNIGGYSVDHYYGIGTAINEYGLIPADSIKNYVVLVTDTGTESTGWNGISRSDVKQALNDANAELVTICPYYADTLFQSDNAADSLVSDSSWAVDYSQSSWGTTLTNTIGSKIGVDAVKFALFENVPLYQFPQMSGVFPSASSSSQVITVHQGSDSYDVTIEPTDTFATLNQKLNQNTGASTNAEVVDLESGKKAIQMVTSIPSGQRVTYSGNQELLTQLGLRSNLDLQFSLDADMVTDKDIHFKNFYINSETGQVREGDIVLTTNSTELPEYGLLTSFEAAYIGQKPKSDVKLSDINNYWDSQGVMMLAQPQTIRITQSNGKTANIMLYATDTIDDVRQKLNDAIAHDLGQSKYTDANNFVSFVKEGAKQAQGDESVSGTLIVRSVVPGHDGELFFSGDEDLLRALGLNTIQQASESTLIASVYDAHFGKIIASNAKASGSEFKSLIAPNIDVELDPMAGLSANWDEGTKRFMLTRKTVYSAFLHLKNNSTVFQTGANMGEDFSIQLADSSAYSLNIQRVNVLTRETASRSLGLIDHAIHTISLQRAKLGAYTNALKHTTNNLTTASTNLSAAESRIRDADMSRTMMDFVRLQILNQSGTSMLAQANQLPQSVMTLMGN